MFVNHIIKNDILYLEIDVNYEFGGNNKKKRSIIDNIKDYINSKNININFKKIIITCSGFIIGSIILLENDGKLINQNNIRYVPSFKETIDFKYENKKTDEEKQITIDESINENRITTNSEEKVQKNSNNIVKNEEIAITSNTESVENTSNISETKPSVPNYELITVHRSNKDVINIPINDYLIGVIASEMPASFNIEAIKAQAVVARTYALKAKASGKVLTDTVSTQSYIDESTMKSKWGNDFSFYYNKIKSAVEETNGEFLTYNGNYIEALYHSTNNGKTESSIDVFGYYYPYLISVTSEFDKSANSYLRTTSIDLNTLSSKLGIPIKKDSNIQIISYTDGGNIKELNIDGKVFSGRNIREMLGLRSADFDIVFDDNNANITTRGFGHGVGMSHYGANGMANAGYSYIDILSHYYPGTNISK